MKKVWLVLVALLLFFLYSYKLLDVPTGLTVDEASFGYNAALISQTGRDQNNRFLPLFVLTTDGKDWRQPVTQYFLAALFKLFGPSIYLLRGSSVIIAIISVIGVYYLARSLLPIVPSVVSALIMATAPLLLIQSHLGLDNIMPIPFVILWLIGLDKHRKNKSRQWLIISALSLGISFYSYKGMRPVVPIWLSISLVWLFLTTEKKIRKKTVVAFLLTILPFFALIPLIERLYAGAIFGGSSPSFNNLYDFFQPYLTYFDPSYLFVIGDTVLNHSTGRHGVLLLASLPLIVAGIYAMARGKETFPKFILIALFSAPLLFGLVGSIHRFSRLMAVLPLYSLAAGFGWQYLISTKNAWRKVVSLSILILILINYVDFVSYYWKTYPGITFSIVGEMDYYKDVMRMAEVARQRMALPHLHKQVADAGGESLKFFQMVYFGYFLPVVDDDMATGKGTLLLSTRSQVPGMKEIGTPALYHLQVGE